MAYKTRKKVINRWREVWEFSFYNVNKQTKDRSRVQTIGVAVLATVKDRYRTTEQRKKEAIHRFTQIVNTMYPNADQHVTSYGPVKLRVFV